MKLLPLTALACSLVCTSHAHEMLVRVTYYNPQDCKYGSKTSTGVKAVSGMTVAVDPRVIPYGTKIDIPGLRRYFTNTRFIAQDTGSAVKSRKAAKAHGRNVPVVDVYCATRYQAKFLAKNTPMFMKVRIVK